MCKLYVCRLHDVEGSADRVGTGEGRADHCTNDGSPASNNVYVFIMCNLYVFRLTRH